MERNGLLREQSDLYVPLQGHQLLQCERGCDAEIGAGEYTDADAAAQGGDEFVGDERDLTP